MTRDKIHLIRAKLTFIYFERVKSVGETLRINLVVNVFPRRIALLHKVSQC